MTTSLEQIGNLTPIARQQVSGEVARQIQRLIASSHLREGDRLPTERGLAAALGVGRGAVREGIKLLAGLDIVEVRQGAGIFVKRAQRLVLLDPSYVGSEERLELLRQATAVRRVLDCAAVEWAASVVSDDSLDQIEQYLVEADSEPNRTRLAHAIDLTFEAMIGEATENPYLIAVQGEAHRFFRTVWEKQGFMPRPASERSNQHWTIFGALKKHDAREARACMEKHFDLQALDR